MRLVYRSGSKKQRRQEAGNYGAGTTVAEAFPPGGYQKIYKRELFRQKSKKRKILTRQNS